MTQTQKYITNWEKNVTVLVQELIKHESNFESYHKDFVKILLLSEPALQQDRFYYPTNTKTDKPLEFENGIGSEFISLDGLLLNSWVNKASQKLIRNPKEQYKLDAENIDNKNYWNNFWNNLQDNLPFKKKTYSIYNVVSDLLRSKPVVETLMSSPDVPYSLLGRIKIVKFDANENDYMIYTRPTLIKPDVSPSGEVVIRAWEKHNETVKKSKIFLGI